MKYSLIALSTLAILMAVLYPFNESSLQMEQKSENFSQTQKAELRGIITKAGILFNSNYSSLADYVKNQVRMSYGSYWNVAVYSRQDFNAKFYLTGTYDTTHQNKRYFQVSDSQPYGFSILILETNNTQYNQAKPTIISQNTKEGSLQYTKSKSQFVSTSQEAGIDLAITTAYTWNKNIVDFSKVLQKLTETNLNEHWEVLTSYESLPNFAFKYTSPYEQWVEYSGYGLGVTHWHVYLWRNVITG